MHQLSCRSTPNLRRNALDTGRKEVDIARNRLMFASDAKTIVQMRRISYSSKAAGVSLSAGNVAVWGKVRRLFAFPQIE
jgi:hypothetical protein